MSLYEAMDSVLRSGDDEGSGDDLCFDDHMTQQEHGTRNRNRQLIAHLHCNTNEEVDGESGNRVQERLREGSKKSRRLGGRTQRQQRTMAVEELGRDTMEDNIGGCNKETPSIRGVLGASQKILDTTSIPSGRTPPQSSTNPTSKANLKRNGNWTSTTLKKALDVVTDHGMKVRTVAYHFGIFATSLRNHLYGLVTTRQRGSKAVLKQQEEQKLICQV
jgi:hypothetical protein